MGCIFVKQDTDEGDVKFNQFKFAELKQYTNDFSDKMPNKQSAYIYKGQMPRERIERGEGRATAGNSGRGSSSNSIEMIPIEVKVFEQDGVSGFESFLKELSVLQESNHPNIVRLYGFCRKRTSALLYEHLDGGCVRDLLASNQAALDNGKFLAPGETNRYLANTILPWGLRAKIALESAKGLAYVHSQEIIHRDFVWDNVILNKDCSEIKVSGFGVVRDNAESSTTTLQGSPGYIDPIYIQEGIVSFPSDVYSFGVMLLELVAGRFIGSKLKQHDFEAEFQGTSQDLELYADKSVRLKLSAETNSESGEGIRSKCSDPELRRVLSIAKGCMADSWEERPTMQEVVQSIIDICKLS